MILLGTLPFCSTTIYPMSIQPYLAFAFSLLQNYSFFVFFLNLSCFNMLSVLMSVALYSLRLSEYEGSSCLVKGYFLVPV